MRNLAAAMEAAVEAGGVLYPVFFFEAEFATATLYAWTGIGDIDWNGHTWTGYGNLASISQIQDTSDVRASGIRVGLNGIDAATIAATYTELRQGKPGILRFGLLDADGNILGDPDITFAGRMDAAVDEDDGRIATIVLSYENRLVDLTRPRERRYTDQDQQIDYPGDVGFEFVEALQDASIKWGRG